MTISRNRLGLIATVLLACLSATPGAATAEPAPTKDKAARPQLRIRPRTPQLVGPDQFEPAPVLVLTKGRVELDGNPMTPDQFEKTLVTLANNYKLLRPADTFNGKFIVACEPEVDAPRLAEFLGRANKAGFPNAMFLFVIVAAGEGANPAKDNLTAANAEIVTSPTIGARPPTVTLKLAKYADCASLSKDLVAHRLQNESVLVDTSRPPPKSAKHESGRKR